MDYVQVRQQWVYFESIDPLPYVVWLSPVGRYGQHAEGARDVAGRECQTHAVHAR